MQVGCKQENKLNNKLIFNISTFIIVSALLFSFISAFDFDSSNEISSIGTFQKGNCVNLFQLCSDCTYVNLTSVKYPSGHLEFYDEEMTKTNSNFNYTFCDTDSLGEYSYNVAGDKGGTYSVENIKFQINPSGIVGTTGFYFLLVVLVALIIWFGFHIENGWVIMLGAIGLLFLGYQIIIYGVDNIKDPLITYPIGLVILFLAIYILIKAPLEEMK